MYLSRSRRQNLWNQAEIIEKNGYRVPVSVKVKDIVLFDQDTDLVKQENETISVDGVNGPAIILGSLTDVSKR